MSNDERRQKIAQRKNNTSDPLKGYESKVFDFESDDKLWDFLKNYEENIFKITDWKVYRHAAESIKEEKDVIKTEPLLELLSKGKVEEFNKQRRMTEGNVLNISGDLGQRDLRGVNLSGLVISGASFKSADYPNLYLLTLSWAEAILRLPIFLEQNF